MIRQIITQSKTPETEWFDPHVYRYWRNRIGFLQREGRILSREVLSETPCQRVTQITWRDWESYLDPLFDVAARPILDLEARTNISNGINTEITAMEVPDVV